MRTVQANGGFVHLMEPRGQIGDDWTADPALTWTHSSTGPHLQREHVRGPVLYRPFDFSPRHVLAATDDRFFADIFNELSWKGPNRTETFGKTPSALQSR